MKQLKLDLQYLARTYGLDPLTHVGVESFEDGAPRSLILVSRPIAADIAADYEAIMSIGTEPDSERVSPASDTGEGYKSLEELMEGMAATREPEEHWVELD